MEKITIIQRMWRNLIPDNIKFEIGNRIAFRKLIRKQYFGEKNKNKQFLVIKSPGDEMGTFSMIFHMLPYFLYAQKKGYIPIVDLQSSFVPMMQDEENKYIENAWVYYFEQPKINVSLEEVYQSKNVRIIPEKSWQPGAPKDWNECAPASVHVYSKWSKVINEYVRLQSTLLKKFERYYESNFPKDKKVLGVSVRAGFRSRWLKKQDIINGHPIIPTCEEFIIEVEAVMKKWGYQYLFLAADDREYQQKIVEYFKGAAIFFERELPHYFEKDEPVEDEKILIEFQGKDHSVKRRNADYILETYLLSRCDSLYACIGGGSEFAYFLNNNHYKYCEFYDKGLYQIS